MATTKIIASANISLKLIGKTLIFCPHTENARNVLIAYGLLEMVFSSRAIALDALFYWANYLQEQGIA
ncbi:MAG TPA: hypothetical protein V6C58_16615 [Allocoleopsis sp.]